MSRRAGYDGIAVCAPVTVPYVRYSIRAAHWFLARALKGLIERAGIGKEQIDGLCVSSFTLTPDTAVGLTQHLGLTPRWLDHIPMGGACGVVALRRAARAVQSGDAEIVACIAGDTNHVDSFRLMLGSFSQFARDAVYPYGAGGPNASFAFLTAYYMRTYGATREDFGKLCVAQRDNALALPACAVQEAADAGGVPRRAPDRRAAAPVRLRHAVRRRGGFSGDERAAGARPRPALCTHPRHHRAPQRLPRRPDPDARRLGDGPRRPVRAGRRRAAGHRLRARPTTTIR